MPISNPPMGGGLGGGGTGPAGASAADIWRDLTNQPNATDAEFLAAITGADGDPGQPGLDGDPGADGDPGQDGADGVDGITVIPFVVNGVVEEGATTGSFPLPVDCTITRAQVTMDEGPDGADLSVALLMNMVPASLLTIVEDQLTADIALDVDGEENDQVRIYVNAFSGINAGTNLVVSLTVVPLGS